MQKQIRKLRVVSLAVLMIFLLSLPMITPGALAATSEDGNWEFTVSGGKVTINKYTGSGGNVTIPSTLSGFPVTSVGEWWDNVFKDCTTVTSVTIPKGVTSIGDRTFEACTSLTSVIFPDSVTSIGDYAFMGCTSLVSLTIPKSVTKVGRYTFYGCASLTSVTIPDSVTILGGRVFDGCTSLTKLVIPNSVTSIGENSFEDCTSLTSITLSNSLSFINYGLFKNCTSLTTMIIPKGVKMIGGYLWEDAFSGCTALTNVTIPKTTTSIADNTFTDCSNLTIYGYKNSVAHEFSVNKNIPFVLLPDPTYKVTFNSKGGSAVPEKTVVEDTTVKKPGDPKRKGYIFEGWYKESACKTAWNFDKDIVTGNITLYAKWTAIKASITPTSNTISKGGTLTLTAAGNATIKSVSWTTSKKANVIIASGAKKQTVTLKGMKKGNSIITAVITFKDGTQKTVKRTVTTK